VLISVVKCSWVKCGAVYELLQCSHGTNNKVSKLLEDI